MTLDKELKNRIHKEIANATVKILVANEFQGSGIFISPDGYVLTAYHCIGAYPPNITIETRFGDQFYAELDEAKTLKHPDYDLAVLKIYGEITHYLPLGFISNQSVGDEIVAMGYPAGDKPGHDKICTFFSRISQVRTDNKIQIPDAIKGKGQSGGPVYHYATQRVIGLATEGYKPDVITDAGLVTRFEVLFDKWPQLEIINNEVAQNWDNRLLELGDGDGEPTTHFSLNDRDQIPVASQHHQPAEKINLENQSIKIRTRLVKYIKVLGKTTYKQIDARLSRIKKEGVDDETEILLEILEQFLSQEISAADLVEFWSNLDQQPTKMGTEALNYQALADRLRRGDIVIFLGTDLLPSLGEQASSREQMVSCLADYVDYPAPGFHGDFPDLCEYIEMNNQFGRRSLCTQLQSLLESTTPHSMKLYQLFARLENPLLLISATYDSQLELTFEKNNKKFVVLSHDSDKENTDTLFLNYSDQTGIQQCSNEDLFSKPLLEQGYSVIYKMLGCINNNDSLSSSQALILSEKDYFTQYQNKLIPGYVVKKLRNRGFWLLGHHPNSWDKRLIIKTILDQRPHEQHALTIFEQVDEFARLYLKDKRIENHPIDLKIFIENLHTQFDN